MRYCRPFSESIRKDCRKKRRNGAIQYIHTLRVSGINVFMGYYLDGEFKNIYLDTVASVKGDDYYIKMGKAWYFCNGACQAV